MSVVATMTSIAQRPAGAAVPLPDLHTVRLQPAQAPQGGQGTVQPILFGDFDANGDGGSDIILIAPPEDSSGVTRVGVISITTDQLLWEFSAEQSGDIVPMAATAGDVNGDGRDDVLITILRWNETEEMMESFVDVRSGVDGALLHRLHSPDSFDSFGVSAAAAGDVNGDGFDDIIIGAPFAGTQMGGYVYVFSGHDGALIHKHRSFAPGSRFGVSVAGLGDVDGDGFADYMAGAPGDEDDETTTGVVLVFSGSDGTTLRTHAATSPGGQFGRNVAALGDITGDGVPELVVTEHAIVLEEDAGGSPLRQGRVHVYSGADGQPLATLESDPGYVFGATLNSTSDDGDLDGFGDILIGASSLQDAMNVEAAMVVVYSGPSLTPVFTSTLGDMVSGGAAVQGPNGDLDGDRSVGIHDLAMLLGEIGSADPPTPAYDLNGDGTIDVSDVTILLDNFGEGPSNQAYGADGCGQGLTALGIGWAVGMFACGVGSVYLTGGLALPACWSFWTNTYLSYGGAFIGGGCVACGLQSLFLNDPNACP